MVRQVVEEEAGQEPEMVDSGRSARKRRAILEAATEVFLRSGYLGTNMDEIAALSEVSKQTVYKHFSSKEALFIEIVSSMTGAAGDRVQNQVLELPDGADLAEYLYDYSIRQLTVVLTPRLMQLRRLVIGEVSRFPDLARELYEGGPLRAMTTLAEFFARMSAAINQAMLLGDAGIPGPAELQRQAREGVRVFLAAYRKS
jgi:TetR/AcrR family transcriptional repressor of mexJK operon